MNTKNSTTIIRISQDAMARFRRIQQERPQDKNNAKTFDHIIYVYEESKLRQDKIA